MSTSAAFFRVPIADRIADGLFAGLRIDGLDHLRVGELQYRDEGATLLHELRLDDPVELQVPGVDVLTLAVLGAPSSASAPGTAPSTVAELLMSPTALEGTLAVRAELRIDASVLRPLRPGSDEPDPGAEYLAVPLAHARLTLGADGDLEIDVGVGVALPRCMIADTGVIVAAGSLRWLTPSTPDLTEATPPGFTGLFLDDVLIDIPGLPMGDGVTMQDVFVGTGGFSGRVSLQGLDLTVRASGATGDLAGTLLGFHGGLTEIELAFSQTQLVACDLAGDVWLPFLDVPVGVRLGLAGSGVVTATVTSPHTVTSEAPTDGFLLSAEIADAVGLDVAALRFHSGSGEPAGVTIDGRVTLDVDVLETPPLTVSGLTIDTDGAVTIEGGWLDLDEAVSAKVAGTRFEITRLGVGTHSGGRRFVALDGGISLAAALPVATSVEGLEVSWDPRAAAPANTVRVRLDGIGVEFRIPGAVSFEGAVALSEIGGHPAFRGHGKLTLPTLDLTIEASLVVGRDGDDTFFFLHVAAELPVGIPLFTTGAALYGLAGLVAQDMAPDRDPESPWYAGWYRPEPTGVTAPEKWTVRPNAFAIGLGATIGTAPDDGFAFHARTLLVLLLPGPQVLLEGKGTLMADRSGGAEPAFEALMVLDVPGKRFEAALSASYEIPVLFKASGTVEAAFSWADNPPPDLWHVYLGREEPEAKRISATWLKVLEADAWLMAARDGLDLGGWAGINKNPRFGPVSVTIDIGIQGRAEVSWRPAHFRGELELGGTVGVRVFGVGVTLTARAEVMAQAPTPWHLRIVLEAGIEVDLGLKTFRWSKSIVLEWLEEQTPEPLDRIVTVALEHEDARVTLPAVSGGPVPADVRPVLVFARPAADPGRIGQVATDAAPDVVGNSEIAYELAHVALRAQEQIVALSGVGSVTGTALKLPDAGRLTGLEGSEVLIGDETLTVTAVAADALTLNRAPASGDQEQVGYRLTVAPRQTAEVVLEVRDHPSGALELLLDREVDADDLPGGMCAFSAAPGEPLLILAVDGATVVCRRGGGARPQPGPATLTSVRAPALAGLWQIDEATGMHDPTRLMLHARTPFAWWRSNSNGTLRRLTESGAACGPPPTERPVCRRIEPDLLHGPKDSVVQAHTTGVTRWMLDRQGRPELWLGTLSQDGAVTLTFDIPVDAVQIRARHLHDTAAAGEIIARLNGRLVSRLPVQDGSTALPGPLTEITVTGRQLAVSVACWTPEWRCVQFNSTPVPNPVSELEIDGLAIGTSGTLSSASGTLEARRGLRGLPFDREIIPFPRRPVGLRVPDLGFEPPTPPIIPLGDNEVEVVLVPPQPFTRVRVTLGNIGGGAGNGDDEATIEAVGPAGVREVARTAGGVAVELQAGERFFTSVAVRAPRSVELRECCWDEGDLGWRRAVRLEWTDSLESVTDVLASEDAVLPPGHWELDVVARAVIKQEESSTTHVYDVVTTPLRIGPPPGLGAANAAPDASYPDGGPLAELATWIRGTEPTADAPAAYRSHDLRVQFSRSHVARMYAAAGTPLEVRVLNAKGTIMRRAEPVLWDGAEHLPTRTEETWIASLELGGGCAHVDPARIARDDQLRVGAGGVLPPSSRCMAQLVADGRVLHRVPFTTSRFIDAAHHLTSGGGSLRHLAAGPLNLSSALASQRPGIAFSQAMAALGLDEHSPLPERLEITRLPQGFLFESPEPINVDRMDLSARFASVVPMQRRTEPFHRRDLPARDSGAFEYAGLDWISDQPLRVRDGALTSDGEGPWLLSLTTTRVQAVEVVIEMTPSGTASLTTDGQQPVRATGSTAQSTTLRLSNVADEVHLRSEATRVLSVTVTEPFQAPAVPGPMRVVAVTPPSMPQARDHAITVRAFEDVNLEGHELRWNTIDPLQDDRLYHRFGARRLDAGRELTVHGHPGAAATLSGGMIQGNPSPDGMAISLRDAGGSIGHRAIGLGTSLLGPEVQLTIVASRDQSRLLVVSPSRPLAPGTWQLNWRMSRTGSGLVTQSVGGDTSEQAITLTLPPAL